MRRTATVAVLVGIQLAGGAPAGGQEDSAPAFSGFEIEAQSQAAAGYLFAVGDEENRLAGARLGVTKPADVYALAAAFQRGLAAGYTYAAVLGRSAGGGSGLAPEPPPGEASALYPSEPRESTWHGPVTAGSEGPGAPVVDGRSHARATAAPAGEATIELQRVSVPEQLTVGRGLVASQGGPDAVGVTAESSSVLEDVTIGSVLKIETLTSRAYGLVPADGGDPVGRASTVVEGATVNGIPVRITSAGLEAGDSTSGAEQKAAQSEAVRQALAAHHIEDVRLDEAEAVPEAEGVRVSAGMLRVLYRDADLAASNPQGFAGGGFEVGGAALAIRATRSVVPPPPPPLVPDTAEPHAPTVSELPAPGPAALGLSPTGHRGDSPVAVTVAPDQPAPLKPMASGSAWPSPGPDAVGVDGFTAAVTSSPTLDVAARSDPAADAPDGRATPPLPATSAFDGAFASRTVAAWHGALFLSLGGLPLLVVLAFRLARP